MPTTLSPQKISSATPSSSQDGLLVNLDRLASPDKPLVFAAAVADLAQEWQQLAARSTTSFFTSWSWIGCWLAGLPKECEVWVLRASTASHTVGLALLVRRGYRRVKGVPIAPAWYVHATGQQDLDSLYIEHNGFLVDPIYAGQAETAMLKHWWQAQRGVRELWIPGMNGQGWPQAWLDQLRAQKVSFERALLTRSSYSVDLEQIRTVGGDFLSTRSSNMRSQIRRSMKAYNEVGPLVLDVAEDADQALTFLDRLIVLHQARWESRALPGSFASEHFTAFHKRLVQQESAKARIQISRLRAGDQEVAYLYSFVHNQHVYFYQSGLNYELGGKHARPGYVAHVLAIELNARLGNAIYDFMDGDDRYKRDLATTVSEMSDQVLRTPSWRFDLERRVRLWREARIERLAAEG